MNERDAADIARGLWLALYLVSALLAAVVAAA